MTQKPDIKTRILEYIRSEIIPKLPEEVQLVSFEAMSWQICVHTYQYAVLDDEPLELLEPSVEALVNALPSRMGEPWQCTLMSHRVAAGKPVQVEGDLVYERQAGVLAENVAIWKPISATGLDELLSRQLKDCTPSQMATFQAYRVEPYQVPIMRNGNSERVFVVARKGSEVMYYEDVEEGFNISRLNSEGGILHPSFNQDELKFAVLRWQDDERHSRADRGPTRLP